MDVEFQLTSLSGHENISTENLVSDHAVIT